MEEKKLYTSEEALNLQSAAYQKGYNEGYELRKKEQPCAVWVKGQYDKLYDQVKGGKRTVCYVDYNWSVSTLVEPARDICTIKPERLEFVSRGHGYGGVAHMPGNEKENFIQLCIESNVEWLDESGAAAAPSVDVAFGVDKWNEWRAWFSIGVQKFHLQNSENKEHAEWYEKMLRKAFANLGNGTAAAGISQDAHEKEVMMQAFDKVRHIFEGRQWVMDGRGSYPYNDDRYKEEVRYMYNEFDQVVKDTWANIKSKSVDYRKAIIAEYLESTKWEVI